MPNEFLTINTDKVSVGACLTFEKKNIIKMTGNKDTNADRIFVRRAGRSLMYDNHVLYTVAPMEMYIMPR